MRLFNSMVSVALTALRPVMLLEGYLVLAAVEQAGVPRVTETATLTHSRQTHRHGCMIAVATIAGWCSQIATFEESMAVNARAVFRQLISGHC